MNKKYYLKNEHTEQQWIKFLKRQFNLKKSQATQLFLAFKTTYKNNVSILESLGVFKWSILPGFSLHIYKVLSRLPKVSWLLYAAKEVTDMKEEIIVMKLAWAVHWRWRTGLGSSLKMANWPGQLTEDGKLAWAVNWWWRTGLGS